MDRCELIETNRGKPCALYCGHQYRKHHELKNGDISWLCRKEKSENCSGRIITKDCAVLRVSDHKCKPDLAATEIQKKIHRTKKRAGEEDLPLPQIYKEEFQDILNRGFNFVSQIPLYSKAKHPLYSIRKKALGFPDDPKSAWDIVLTNEMLELGVNKESFLLLDDQVGDRIIIFATSKGRKALAESKTCFIDGTFKSCPKQFYQIFTIHIDLGSTQEFTKVIPAVYAFLPNKQKQTYERFFTLMTKRIPDWKPSEVNMDFEIAVILSIMKVFPDVDIHGCNYHFNQSLWRKVQECGLVSEYTGNEEIKLHVRMCSALAHLPLQDLDDGWLCIQENSPKNPRLQAFYDYFVEQWMENSIITRNIWNCHYLRHRTNNPVEGWNSRFNKIVKKANPNFYSLVNCLKKEAEYNDFLYDRHTLNLDGKRRKRLYVKLDETIKKTLDSYNENKDLRKCLEILSYVQKF